MQIQLVIQSHINSIMADCRSHTDHYNRRDMSIKHYKGVGSDLQP